MPLRDRRRRCAREGTFQRPDHAGMAGRPARLKGRFILSINDHAEVRQTFAGLAIDAAATTYPVAREGTCRAGELIIASGQASA